MDAAFIPTGPSPVGSIRLHDQSTRAETKPSVISDHPNTKGVYGLRGSVADYLEQQGVAPFFDMGDRYGAAYRRMVERLECLGPDELQRRPGRRNDVDETEPGQAASSWIDIDRTIAEFCNANRRPIPVDIDEAVTIHLEAINSWITSLEASD